MKFKEDKNMYGYGYSYGYPLIYLAYGASLKDTIKFTIVLSIYNLGIV